MYDELKQALAKDAANYTWKMVCNLYNTGKRITKMWGGYSVNVEVDVIPNESNFDLELYFDTRIRLDMRKYLKAAFSITKKVIELEKDKHCDECYVKYGQKILYENLTKEELDDIYAKVKVRLEVEEVLNTFRYNSFKTDNIDVIKDIAKFIINMIDSYKKSTKFEVAFNFDKDLIAKESIIINKYSKYFLDNNIPVHVICNIISNRIKDSLRWIED